MRKSENLRATRETRFGVVKRRMTAAAVGLAMIASFTQPALASDQSGIVTKVAFAGGRFLFWLSGPRGGAVPACDCCRRWEISVADANSQARMSLVLTAYAQGRPMVLAGLGSCVAGANDTEGVDYFEVS